MKFVLVNHRTPLNHSACAECSGPLGPGYLKAVSTQRQYCDHDCYVRGEARGSVLTAPHAIPFEMMTSFTAALCCYSIAVTKAALRISELMTSEISGGSGQRRT
jgi:hypothetical protein